MPDEDKTEIKGNILIVDGTPANLRLLANLLSEQQLLKEPDAFHIRSLGEQTIRGMEKRVHLYEVLM